MIYYNVCLFVLFVSAIFSDGAKYLTVNLSQS